MKTNEDALDGHEQLDIDAAAQFAAQQRRRRADPHAVQLRNPHSRQRQSVISLESLSPGDHIVPGATSMQTDTKTLMSLLHGYKLTLLESEVMALQIAYHVPKEDLPQHIAAPRRKIESARVTASRKLAKLKSWARAGLLTRPKVPVRIQVDESNSMQLIRYPSGVTAWEPIPESNATAESNVTHNRKSAAHK